MQDAGLEDVINIIATSLKNYRRPVVTTDEKVFWMSYLSVLPEKLRAAINNEIIKYLNKMKIQNDLEASIIKSRFIDDHTITKTALDHYLSRDQINRKQKKGIENLSFLIFENLIERRKKHRSFLLADIPSSQIDNLIGVKEEQKDLYRYLTAPNNHYMISVSGIGGIGKTTLVSSVVKNIISEDIFKQVIWIKGYSVHSDILLETLIEELSAYFDLGKDISNKTQALLQILKNYPCLIIIDGVKSIAQWDVIVNNLVEFTVPSKLLIISRIHSNNPVESIANINLGELDKESSLTLMISYATSIGIQDMDSEIQLNIEEIYEIIGGNPLALRLFIGLSTMFSISVLLSDFRKAEIIDIEQLYHIIFLKSWSSLLPDSQTMLKIIALSKPNEDIPLNQITEVFKGESKDIYASIQELFYRSLIEKRTFESEFRYGIHSLTRSFLISDIIRRNK